MTDMSVKPVGEPIFKFKTQHKQWPVEAGTWNHRAEACYRAFQDAPQSDNVRPVLCRGLVAVKFIHWRIPGKIWQRFIVTHNTFHKGSGSNFQDYLEDALAQEAEWERYVSHLGMHSSNPSYKATYKDFVMRNSYFDCLF